MRPWSRPIDGRQRPRAGDERDATEDLGTPHVRSAQEGYRTSGQELLHVL